MMGRFEPGQRFVVSRRDWTLEECNVIRSHFWCKTMVEIQGLPETEHPGIRYTKGPDLKGRR